jgi:small subunit ribosomal protein S15
MALVAEEKRQIIARNQTHKTDTGSPEVQIALLTDRIVNLTQKPDAHFKIHQKDHASRRGMLSLVARRRRLLTYLKVNSPERYKSVLVKLSIRPQV